MLRNSIESGIWEERKLKLVLSGTAAEEINRVILDYVANFQEYAAGKITADQIQVARRHASEGVILSIDSPL